MLQWKGRPALVAALALGSGVASSAWYEVGPVALVGAVALVLICVAVRKQHPVFLIPALFCAIALLGNVGAATEASTYQDAPLARLAQLGPAHTTLFGRLEDARENTSHYSWVVAADSIAIDSGHAIPMSGALLLWLRKERPNGGTQMQVPGLPAVGSYLKIYCSLEPFHPASNPHEYAAELALQTHTRTSAQGIVHSRFDYYILAAGTSTWLQNAAQWLTNIREYLSTVLDTAVLDRPARGFVKAVVIGERNDLDRDTLDDFTTAGVAHLLSVSGFNVAIVALVVVQLLRFVGIYRLKLRTLLTMGAVLLYAGIVGLQPSVVRATLMIELYLLAVLLERTTDSLNILAGAAAIELLLRPADLFDVGFQLSYGAVAGLLLIAPRIRALLAEAVLPVTPLPVPRRHWKQYLIDAVSLSLGASIAAYPIIAVHFYRVSFIGLIANLPLVPLAAVITALGFLLIPMTVLSIWLGQLYGEGITYLSTALLGLTKLSAHVPFAASSASRPSWIFLVFLIGTVVYVLRSHHMKMAVVRITLGVVAYFTLSMIGLPMSDTILKGSIGRLQALFFDVGQGDGMLLCTPSHRIFLIDFGGESRDGLVTAERTVLPFLRAEGISRIDGGFISHSHLDHFGGTPAILESVAVSEIFTSGERVRDSTAERLERDVRRLHVPTRVLSRGDTLHLDSNVTLYVLHPDRRTANALQTQYGQHINNGSLVFRIVYGQTSFLFLGDIEQCDEEELRAAYGPFLQSTVVKVAHHGSRTSSSPEFVAATRPTYAVISVGAHNTFGHPAAEVVRRWALVGANIYRTDRDGAVLFESDGASVRRRDWR